MMRSRHAKTLRTIPFLIAACLIGLPANAQYSGGTGEPNDPYQIATAADLIALGETPEDYDKHFRLMADIDMGAFDGQEGRPAFNIIGDCYRRWYEGDEAPYLKGTAFTGVFDGNGHAISHLTVKTQSGCAGLFGGLGPAAHVRNLGVVDVNIASSDDAVGALVGFNSGGTLMNCYSTGVTTGGLGSEVGGLVGLNKGTVTRCYSTSTVSGTHGVGGLVGYMYGGTVTQCYSTGAVNGVGSVGGLVGENWYVTLTQCYSTGAVSGTERVGGLVGCNDSVPMTKCYSTGIVSGTERVGGLVGTTWGGNLTHCYSAGAVSGSKNVGGLVGCEDYPVVVTACFWDIQTSGQVTSAGGTGKTTAEMQTASTFLDAGWDFVGESANGTHEFWLMPEGGGSPVLAILSGYIPRQLQGHGTPESPYWIFDAWDLGAVIHHSPSGHYQLAASIDLSGVRWATAVIPRFTGVFEGNNRTISNLTIDCQHYVGLFGRLQGAVRNLGVVDVNITGSGCCVGALAGENYGEIRRSYSTGAVSGLHDVGGLVGNNTGGDMPDCYSTAAVSGVQNVGGLLGVNQGGGKVTRCCSAGTVCGGKNTGGLVGWNLATVTDCYSTGPVSGTEYVGGLVGESVWGDVMRCYSTGAVSGTKQVGGLAGYTSYWLDRVGASFWDIQTSGQTASSGGAGKTTAEMKTAKTFLDAGWDFVGEAANGTDDIWWILEGKDYPRLWWDEQPTRLQSSW